MIDNNSSPLEDKRTAIAILLCLIVVMVYSEIVMAPYTRQTMQAPVATIDGQTVQNQGQGQSQNGAQNGVQNGVTQSNSGFNNGVTQQGFPQQGATRVGYPTPAELKAAPSLKVKSDLFSMTINTLGGRVESLKLDRFKQSFDSAGSYEMVTVKEGSSLPLAVYAGGLNDDFVSYKLVDAIGATKIGDSYKITSNDVTLSLVGTLSNGTEIKKTFIFHPDTYLFDLNVKLSTSTPDGSRVRIEWPHFKADIKNINTYDFEGAARLSDGSVSRTYLTDIAEGSEILGSDTWIEYGDKYFTTALIPLSTGQNTALVRRENTIAIKAIGTPDGGEFKLYVGPKETSSLKQVGFNLHQSIDLGFFAVLAHPLLDLLRFLDTVFGNYGLAIVMLTLIIKALFLPLTKKSFKSMGAMQELQPKIKLLREKHSSDPTKMNQELMALYKKEGINPMGGCFPMLIQLPVFLGLYNVLLNSIELRHAPFAIWITDLSAPESFQLWGIGIPVMVILMGISMFVQQWTTPSVMDPMQKKIMMFMPIVFTFFFIGFPAGLVLYWLVNNIVSIVQQVFIRRERSAGATRATVLASVGIFGFAYILTLI